MRYGILSLVGFFIVLVSFSGCSSGGSDNVPVNPNIIASGTVDAKGGVVAVSDPTSPYVGTKVEIPAGTFSGAMGVRRE